MTSLNNLKGRIIKEGNIIYDEILDNGLHFSIICKYEDKYRGANTDNHQNSSRMDLTCCINNGEMHTWTNGVVSLKGEEYIDKEFGELMRLKTKDGYPVYQVELMKGQTQRTLKWIVEVPREGIIKLLNS